jgi:predicted DsbA family dithiol-disulfide isomerase
VNIPRGGRVDGGESPCSSPSSPKENSMRLRLRALLFVLGALLLSTPAAAQEFLPGVDGKGLDADEQKFISEMMKEGVCPCDAKASMLDCIQRKDCEKATDLARFGVEKFREGLGEDQVREAVVRKYFDDNVTFDWFDLKDTPRKGAAKPKVTIVEFADFECPHCAMLAKILPEVIKAYPNDVALYFKNFPLPSHTWAEAASRACFAAGKQNKFWQMYDLVFSNQLNLSAEKFNEFAAELGLNGPRFKADMESPEAHKYVERDRAEGTRAGLTGTPTLYMNGKLYYGEKTLEAMKAHVEKLLKAKPAPKR